MRTLFSVLLLFCTGQLAVFAQGTSDADTASKILALESAWNQAVETRDTKALDAIFDNLLIYVEHDGSVMTKAEYLTTVKNSGGNPEHVTTEKMTAHVWGATAIVTGIYHERGLRANKLYHRRGRFIDTWIFKNNTWVCVAAQATLLQP
jgi:ketosteroid isomerase-like protein